MRDDRPSMQVGDVVEGCIIFWHLASRYGFVRVDGLPDDVFVSWRALQASTDLHDGERVRLELAMGRDGRYRGECVELLDGAEDERTA